MRIKCAAVKAKARILAGEYEEMETMIACEALPLNRKYLKKCLCLTRHIPMVNQGIFKGETLLPYVSSTPVWRPLKDGEKNIC